MLVNRADPEAETSPDLYTTTTVLDWWCSFYEMLCSFYARCNGTQTKSAQNIFQTSQIIWIEPNESCSSLDIVLDSFVTSWMSHQCLLEVTLVGQPILGRYAPVPRFLYMWFSLESQSKWFCTPFQTQKCQRLCFSAVSSDCSIMYNNNFFTAPCMRYNSSLLEKGNDQNTFLI